MDKQLVSLKFMSNSRCECKIAENAVFFLYRCFWDTNDRNGYSNLEYFCNIASFLCIFQCLPGSLDGAT